MNKVELVSKIAKETGLTKKDSEAAVKALNEANSLLDKAATSRLKHKNYVARQKSRLAKSVSTLG